MGMNECAKIIFVKYSFNYCKAKPGGDEKSLAQSPPQGFAAFTHHCTRRSRTCVWFIMRRGQKMRVWIQSASLCILGQMRPVRKIPKNKVGLLTTILLTRTHSNCKGYLSAAGKINRWRLSLHTSFSWPLTIITRYSWIIFIIYVI